MNRLHRAGDSKPYAKLGQRDATITSPKLGLIFAPWYKSEFFVNADYGFHSNDARGTVITVDPTSGAAADPVTPLVRTKGAELGLRTHIIFHVESSIAI